MVSDLHASIARAIADANDVPHRDAWEVFGEDVEIAVRMVLAEAQRVIEALEPRADAAHFAGPLCIYRREALAALAALGEQE